MLYLCIYIVVYFVITYTGIKMSISVIEGNYIKMGNNCNEIEQDAMNLTGYLRISVKKNNGGFEDGYIFMKRGQKIGYYHEDGMEESTGKKAEELINKMKEQEHTVEVYEYDDNKLNLMKEMFGEIFKIGAPKEKKNTIKNTVITQSSNSSYSSGNNNLSLNKDYTNIVLNIPDGAPLNMGANVEEYKQYLGGYKLIRAFNKDDNEYKEAYIIYDNNTPILMAYEDGNGVLFGESSKDLAEQVLNSPNSIVDVFDYNTDKINILKEYYPRMSLKQNQTFTENKGDEDINEFMDSLLANNKKNKEEEENLSKEELLKKLGIGTIDDNLIDNLIDSITEPTYDELLNLKNELEDKIHEIIKNEENISSYSLDVSVEYDKGYTCKCNIEIVPEKTMGFKWLFRKNVNTQYIIDKINRMIRENILGIEPEVNITIIK